VRLYPNLQGVWGASSDNVFAVGSPGAILHFDGSTWSWMTVPPGTPSSLREVWGADASHVFVVGDGGAILFYNGATWASMATGTTANLSGVWGFSPTDVYAVGNAGTILHYDGTAWSPMASGTSLDINAVWGPSATDVFAATDGGLVLRSNGTAWWTFISQNTGCPYEPPDFFDVWGTSSDLFAVGDEGRVLHFSGRTLTFMDTGTDSSYWRIWGTGPSDVFLLAGYELLHYDGASWKSVSLPDFSGPLAGIWGSSPEDVFAVGWNGTILRSGSVAPPPPLKPLPPAFSLTMPNGGQRWRRGATRTITWSGGAETGRVTIKLYRGASLRSTLARNAADSGAYSWRISPRLPRGSNYRIKVIRNSDRTVFDASDTAFSLR
jgi:hypothetical protein